MLAYFIYILAAAFLVYEMGLQVSPSVMTADLMRDLKIDAAGLGIIGGVYFYSYTLMQIFAGLLYDRYSLRLLVSLSLFICALGALFFGISDTSTLAGTGRFLMGIGSAFAFIGVLVVAAKWFPANYFALLVGIAQLLAALGAMSGELPLAEAVNKFGWRSTLNWLAVSGFILTVLTIFVIQEKPNTNLNSKTSRTTEGIVESLKEVLGESQTWWIALYAFCGWAPVTAFAALWGIPYLVAVYGISNTLAASAIAMIWIGIGIASPVLGWFSDLIQRRCILLSVCAVIGVIATLSILYIPHLPFSMMFVLLFCFGIAAAGQIITFALVKDNNKISVVATAIGFNNMAVVAGGALLQPLVGILLRTFWDGRMQQQVPIYSIHDYHIALLAVPVCFLIGWIVNALMIRETYCQAKYPVKPEGVINDNFF